MPSKKEFTTLVAYAFAQQNQYLDILKTLGLGENEIATIIDRFLQKAVILFTEKHSGELKKQNLFYLDNSHGIHIKRTSIYDKLAMHRNQSDVPMNAYQLQKRDIELPFALSHNAVEAFGTGNNIMQSWKAGQTQLIAHRGTAISGLGFVENTLAAIKAKFTKSILSRLMLF